ncbi:hypothetical protein SAMD00019534_054660, partial [Acytostelium subglobosum LB1]|uniref:hypothetical protein n=1 Tax=Acytostelium subglobosum LB1 TaxID=1410327 RepID=UPI000644E026
MTLEMKSKNSAASTKQQQHHQNQNQTQKKQQQTHQQTQQQQNDWRALRSFQLLQLSNDDEFNELMAQANDIQQRVNRLNERINDQKNDVNLIKLSLYYVKEKQQLQLHGGASTANSKHSLNPNGLASASTATNEAIAKNFESIKQSIINNENEYQALMDDECKLNDRINLYIVSKFELKKNEISNPYILEELKYAYLSIVDSSKRTQYINTSNDYDDSFNQLPYDTNNINSNGINNNLNSSNSSISSNGSSSSSNSSVSSSSSNNSNGNSTNTKKYILNDNNSFTSQSPLSFYSMLNIPSKSFTFTQPINTNNKSPNQCTQPTIDKLIFIKENEVQVQLRWSCSSNVQEFCLEMMKKEDPQQQQFSVIYRGYNNYYTTPGLDSGNYSFKVRATNRFGVGPYSLEFTYVINDSVFQDYKAVAPTKEGGEPNGIHPALAKQQRERKEKELQRQHAEELQRVKKRDDLCHEINKYLNQASNANASRSIASSEELLKNLHDHQARLSQQCGEALAAADTASNTLHGATLDRLSTNIQKLEELLESHRVVGQWKQTIKKSISDYLNSGSQEEDSDNEYYDALLNVVSSLSADQTEQVRSIVYQMVVQTLRKKLNVNNNLLKTRSSVVLDQFAKRTDVFHPEWCAEMESLSKQLMAKVVKPKKKEPAVSPVKAEPPRKVLPNNKKELATSSNRKLQLQQPQQQTTKLQIKTTPLITVEQRQPNPPTSSSNPKLLPTNNNNFNAIEQQQKKTTTTITRPLDVPSPSSSSMAALYMPAETHHQQVLGTQFTPPLSLSPLSQHTQSQAQPIPVVKNQYFHLHSSPMSPPPLSSPSMLSNQYPHQYQHSSLISHIQTTNNNSNMNDDIMYPIKNHSKQTPQQFIVSPPKQQQQQQQQLHQQQQRQQQQHQNDAQRHDHEHQNGYSNGIGIGNGGMDGFNSSTFNFNISPFEWVGFPSVLTNLTSPLSQLSLLSHFDAPSTHHHHHHAAATANGHTSSTLSQSLFSFDPHVLDSSR